MQLHMQSKERQMKRARAKALLGVLVMVNAMVSSMSAQQSAMSTSAEEDIQRAAGMAISITGHLVGTVLPGVFGAWAVNNKDQEFDGDFGGYNGGWGLSVWPITSYREQRSSFPAVAIDNALGGEVWLIRAVGHKRDSWIGGEFNLKVYALPNALYGGSGGGGLSLCPVHTGLFRITCGLVSELDVRFISSDGQDGVDCNFLYYVRPGVDFRLGPAVLQGALYRSFFGANLSTAGDLALTDAQRTSFEVGTTFLLGSLMIHVRGVASDVRVDGDRSVLTYTGGTVSVSFR